MKNWLITLANGPRDFMGGLNYQYLTVYASSEEEAERMGQSASNLMQGYWTVHDTSALE